MEELFVENQDNARDEILLRKNLPDFVTFRNFRDIYFNRKEEVETIKKIISLWEKEKESWQLKMGSSFRFPEKAYEKLLKYLDEKEEELL